jgi:hypothetical protein
LGHVTGPMVALFAFFLSLFLVLFPAHDTVAFGDVIRV